jgi:GNAT superfamily N-acetyltransferase
MKKFSLIPYIPDKHLPSLSVLLTQIENHDHNGEDPSEAFLRDMLSWPNFDPENDCWVIPHPNDPATLIGYGSTFAQIPSRCYSLVVIHPDFRRRGLGSRLLSNVIERTRQHGAHQLAIDANKDNLAATAFLYHHQFQPVGHSWVMRRPSNLAISQPEWPKGYTIRRYPEFEDPQLLADALNSFQDRWGHGQNEQPTTVESVQNIFKYRNPEGIFVAFSPDGSAAGWVAILFNNKEDENGRPLDVLDAPGVVPEHRHLHLQRPLVQAALQYQQSKSQNDVELQSWGDPPETASLYYDLGFDTSAHFISYLRNL